MTTEINSNSNGPSAPKKRVLFIVTQTDFGGAQRFLTEFLPHLDKDCFEILVASETGKNSGFFDFLKQNGIETKGIGHLKREISPWSDFKALREIRDLIKEYGPNTLFLCSSKAGFLGSLASIFPSKLKTKVIYRIGGWTFNDPWPVYKKWLWILLERLSAHWKDVIIVNNSFDFDQAKKLKIRPREKLLLIYNGIDPYKTEFLSKEDAREKIIEKVSKTYNQSLEFRNIVGTIANFYPTKGLKYLIESATNFNGDETIFVIIGDGLERETLEKLIKEKKLSKKVFLLGQIPDARRLLPGFDVFVLPSIKEGFPWALLEAMSAKVPVIASGVGAVPEMIDDGKNGFLAWPAKSGQLAQKIQKVIFMDDHQKQELGIQAHQTVLHKFSLEKMLSETEKLL